LITSIFSLIARPVSGVIRKTKVMFGLTETELQDIIAVLEKHRAVKKAIVFGSRAKGNFRTGSGFDISIAGEEIDHETVNTISFTLNEETLLPYHFDVIDYASIKNPELVAHIERVGKTLYQRPESRR
jgi:predicted nucleotidyltransferase